jgi:hypothetical protein
MYLGGLLCLASLLCSGHLGILGLLSDGVARHLDVVGSLHTRNRNSPLLSRSERETTTKGLRKRKHKQSKREAKRSGNKGKAIALEVKVGKEKDEFFGTDGAG